MKLQRLAMALACALLAASTARAAKFTTPPAASAESGNTVITFAVDAPTDVAVAIVDGDGKVVRHLAAGVLGDAAPAPLKAGSLAQAIVWDGNNDAGQPVPAGRYKARVSLGLSLRQDKLIGDAPTAFGSINALAAGPDGSLYVYDGGQIFVLDRNGDYLRQIKPYPAGIDPARIAGLDPVKLDDGSIFCRRDYPSAKWVGSAIGSMAISPDGKMLYLPGPPRYARNLTRIGVDGSVPAGAFDTRLTTHADNGYLYLACSPDGKTLYFAGAEAGYMGDDARELSYRQSVYRLKLGTAGPAEIFTGDDENSGRGFSVNHPKGLAVDPAGNLYVCNYGGDNVTVYTPGAGALRTYEIANPQQVAVNPKTGQVYVLAGSESHVYKYGYHFPPTMHDAKLTVFSADGKVQKELEIDPPYLRNRKDAKTGKNVARPEFNLRMAVDFSQPDKPVIWLGVASPNCAYAKWALRRIEDLGDKFGEPKEVFDRGDALTGMLQRTAYDPQRDILYMNGGGGAKLRRYTGDGQVLETLRLTDEKGAPLNLNVAEHAVGPDGMIYFSAWGSTYHKGNTINRVTPEGKLAPFPAGTPTIDHIQKGSSPASSRGFAVTPSGEMFLLYYDDNPPAAVTPEVPWDKCIQLPTALAKFSADGKPVNLHQVHYLRSGANGVRIDSRGNIYVADNFMPVGVSYPSQIAKVMPDNPLDRDYPARLDDASFDPLLRWIGCVLKFGPDGGKVVGLPDGGNHPATPAPGQADLYRPAPPVQWFVYNAHNLKVTGALWQFHGIAPMPAQYQGVTHVERCVCTGGRFDLDPFDRVYVPDNVRNRIIVLDSNGNLIGRFGQYANRDGVKDALGLVSPGWVTAASDRVYIGDAGAHRIVKAGLRYAVEAECNVTAAATGAAR